LASGRARLGLAGGLQLGGQTTLVGSQLGALGGEGLLGGGGRSGLGLGGKLGRTGGEFAVVFEAQAVGDEGAAEGDADAQTQADGDQGDDDDQCGFH
ncbi:MAG TPA: hypothetical protein DCS97_13660, partial [Planctomycetes bacterium]|nr:hypothetical protein [Planctomycetota bacterium]